jgi:ketosteroid isomerase-like protein
MMRFPLKNVTSKGTIRAGASPMKTTLCLLVAVLVSAGLLAPLSAQKETETAKVTALENKWSLAYKQRDVSAMNSLLADDFLITIEDGSTFSKVGYIAHCNDKNTRVDVSEFADMKVRIRGNTAIVTGQYHEQGLTGGKPYEYHDRFTDVWMIVEGRWQVVASHYSIPVKGANA